MGSISKGSVRRGTVQWAAGVALACLAITAQAAAPAGEAFPTHLVTIKTTPPPIEQPYRAIGARHLYDTFGQRIYKGKLPPLLYAIAIVDTDIDEEGRVVNAVITREPAVAKEVMPWILGLIRQASPFPKPGIAGGAHYHEIWLVDRNYMFQLDTLTEGQE